MSLEPSGGASKHFAPPSSTLDYNQSGNYAWEKETLAGEQYDWIQFTLPNLAWLDTASGSITVKLIDLGAL